MTDTAKVVPLTIVIPTLGLPPLANTITAINAGSVIPELILVSIPEDSPLTLPSIPNLEILRVPCKGQVAQRIEAFKRVTTAFAMQMDDDVILENNCLELLMDAIGNNSNSAVSPALISVETGISLYSLNVKNTWARFYYRLLNGKRGYQPGVVTLAGTCFGIAPAEIEQQSLLHTEWLPGGCLIFRTENLVLENFYPFEGKAYSEDIFLSDLLKSKGMSLYIVAGAKARVDEQPPLINYSLGNFLAWVKADGRARRHFVKKTGRSLFRLYLYYFLQILIYGAAKLKRLVKKRLG